MKIARKVQPPAGLRRMLFRLPLGLYRLGLGWMFGHRLLVLHHVGRVSGRPRRVLLEVVARDRDGSYIVASGWGPDAAWYRNVRQAPEVTVQVGRRMIPATGQTIPPETGAEIFALYAARHRRVARWLLPRLMGYSVDGSEADFRAIGQRIPFLRLVPRAA